MINVDERIKQTYDISTTQIDKIIIDNEEYRITNVQYSDDCYEEGNIFGTAIARCLEFEIENNIDLERTEIEYLTGIYTNLGIKWISLGNFIVQDIEPNDTTNITKVTAMDYMLKSNIEYISNLQYENEQITLLQVAQEACQQAGIELATLDFANSDFIVDSNQFTQGSLIRQVFQAIAQISGTVAKIKSDNKLYFINPNFTTAVSKVFTLNNYEEAEIKRATHPINLVSLSMKDVEGENITLRYEESILEDGENSLIINDNPFAYTQEKREQLIPALFEAVKGFEYKAFTFDCQCLPYLETMDKIQFKDKENNTYDSYIFRFNYKSPNGLESTIEAPSIIKATVEYQNIPDALDKAKRTEIIVDKQNQTITDIIKEQSQYEEKLVQVEQSIDNIKSTVASKDEVKEQINELKQTIEGTTNTLTNTGGNNIFYYNLDYWEKEENTSLGIEEYSDTDVQQNTVSKLAYRTKNGIAEQQQVVKNGIYTISFLFKKLIEMATGYVEINGTQYSLNAENINEWKEETYTVEITSNTIDIKIVTDTDNSFIIADLMVANGNEKVVWSQNPNETITDTVTIGKGIQVESSTSNTYTRIDADGNRTFNSTTKERVAEMTDKGVYTKELEVQNEAKINALFIQKVGDQVWLTGIGG